MYETEWKQDGSTLDNYNMGEPGWEMGCPRSDRCLERSHPRQMGVPLADAWRRGLDEDSARLDGDSTVTALHLVK